MTKKSMYKKIKRSNWSFIKCCMVMLIAFISVFMVILGNSVKSRAEGTPRLLVEDFEITDTSENGKAVAGKEFTVTVHLKNASTKTALYNVLVNLYCVDNEFIPAQGAGSTYIEKIGMGETVDIELKMSAKSDLEQKPYILNVKADYEDRYNMPYGMEEKLSIPVCQEQRIMVTDNQISTDVCNVGKDAGLSFTINNVGKTSLYNTRVMVEGNCIENAEVFIGNISAGQAGYADLVLKCLEVTNEAADEKITATVYYEDIDGRESSFKNELKLKIEPAVELSTIPEEEIKEESIFEKTMPYIIILAIIAVVVVIIVVSKKRKDDDGDEDY